MGLLQVIYSSQPFGYDDAILGTVLMDARRCNRRDGITGALICRADIYLQLLEGPEQRVQAALERIRRDDRHVNVTLHLSEPVSERMFGEWDMLHDPARSWIWTQKEIAEGAVERATPEEIREVFTRLSERKRTDHAD
jgi:hypothetical protein